MSCGRTCVRNFCTNPACRCAACTPRRISTPQPVPPCTCTLDYAQAPAWRSDPPSDFHVQASGELVCPHRDVSCCPICAAANREIIEVYGQHFWMETEQELTDLARAMAESQSQGDPDAA